MGSGSGFAASAAEGRLATGAASTGLGSAPKGSSWAEQIRLSSSETTRNRSEQLMMRSMLRCTGQFLFPHIDLLSHFSRCSGSVAFEGRDSMLHAKNLV